MRTETSTGLGDENESSGNSSEYVEIEDGGFANTQEYRLFVEFCEEVRHYRHIGLCVGPAGVGKTVSAKRYARWDLLGPLFSRYAYSEALPAEVSSCHTVYYHAAPANTPKSITTDIDKKRGVLSWLVDAARSQEQEPGTGLMGVEDRTEVVIVDEAQFLKGNVLEQVRYLYDRYGFGLILSGMTGLDRMYARYPQLYSRIGLLHHYRALGADAVRELMRDPSIFGVELSPEAFSEDAVNAMIRYSEGNFRTLEKLSQRVECLLPINKLTVADTQVVDRARHDILLGP